MIIPSRDNPSPHDWPEDWADPEEDNGAYPHVCADCSVQFLGHKRRLKVCKACSIKREDEMKRRVDILVEAGLNPMEWVLTPASEHDKERGRAIFTSLALHEERKLRRKLASALVVADGTNSNVAYWGHPERHRDTSLALIEESAELDSHLKIRQE